MNTDPKYDEPKKAGTDELNRRDFLKRLGYASVLTLAAGGLGLALYDAKGPAPSEGQKALTGLGDFTSHGRGRGPGENGHRPGHGPDGDGRAGG